MDTFGQAAAYLQPYLEYAAKIGSIIPLWMLLVVMDKHLLRLPVFEGSFWYSPRIPPRFTIRGRHAVKHDSSPNCNRRSTSNSSVDPIPEEVVPFGSSPVERGFAESTKAGHQPSHPSHPAHPSQPSCDSLPVSACGSSALSIYQPLEVHDPFNTSSSRLEPGLVGCAMLLVLVLVLFRIFLHGRCFPFGKDEATQAHQSSDIETPSNKPSGQQPPAAKTGSCWRLTFEEPEFGHSDILVGDYLEDWMVSRVQEPSEVGQGSTAIQAEGTTSIQTQSAPPATPHLSSSPATASNPTRPLNPAPVTSTQALSSPTDVAVDMASSPPIVDATSVATASPSSMPLTHTSAASTHGILEEAGGSSTTTGSVGDGVIVPKRGENSHSGRKTPESKDENEQRESEPESTVAEEKPKDRKYGNEESGSEAGEEDGKECWEEDRKGCREKGGTKKKRVRQNAKKREKRRMAEEEARLVEQARLAENARMVQEASQEEREARTEAREAHNAFPQDTKKSEEEELQDSDLLSTGLGEALNKVKKKRRRRKHRNSQVTGLAPDDIDHELDNLAESSRRGLVTDNTEDKEGQEENRIGIKHMHAQANQLPLANGKCEGLLRTDEDEQMRKNKPRPKQVSFLPNRMPGLWQGEGAQTQRVHIVNEPTEYPFGVGHEGREPVSRLPVVSAFGKMQNHGRKIPNATLNRTEFSSQLPEMASPTPYTPRNPNYSISFRPPGPLAWQNPWNELATRKWDQSAAAVSSPIGSLPYLTPPFEHRRRGFVNKANFAPSNTPYPSGSHFFSRPATTTLDRLIAPVQSTVPCVDVTDAGDVVGLGIGGVPIDRSAERYQYFPERGIRSRSSPPRDRFQSRSAARRMRPQSSPPRGLP